MAENENAIWPDDAQPIDRLRRDTPIMSSHPVTKKMAMTSVGQIVDEVKLEVNLGGQELEPIMGGTQANPTQLPDVSPTAGTKVVRASQGWYSDGENLFEVQEEYEGKFWFETSWRLAQEIPLPAQPATGKIVEGDAKPVSGDTSRKYLKGLVVGNVGDITPFTLERGPVSQTGGVGSSENWIHALISNAKPSTMYTVEGLVSRSQVREAFEDRRVIFYNGSTYIGRIGSYGQESFTFETPAGTTSFRVTIDGLTGVGSDIPNSPFWDIFSVFEGLADQAPKLVAEKIKGVINTPQIRDLEASATPSGVIIDGDERGVSGSRVYNTLDPLVHLTGPGGLAFTLIRGEISKSNGSTNTSNNWIGTDFIAIDESETYTITGFGSTLAPISNGRVHFYDGSSWLGFIDGGYLQDHFSFQPMEGATRMKVQVDAATNAGVDVPNSPYWNTFKVYIGPYDEQTMSLPYLRAEKIKGVINTQQIQNVESVTSKISPLIKEQAFEESIITAAGALTRTGNSVSAAAGYRRTSVTATNSMVSVVPGKEYKYTGSIKEGDIYAGVLYIDQSLQIIGYEYSVGGTWYRAPLNVPEDAAYIATCSFNSEPIIEEVRVTIDTGNTTGGSATFYVNASYEGQDSNGTSNRPFRTINEAIASVGSSPASTIIVYAGSYRETLNTGGFPTGKHKIVAMDTHTVKILGSSPIEGWSKTAEYANVYEVPFTMAIPSWSREKNPIFEDRNPSKEILDTQRHPLQKQLRNRLPFTAIMAATSLEEVDSTPGTYFVTGGKMYIHTSDGSNPATNGYSYENIVRSANTINSFNTNKKVDLEIKGLQFYFFLGGVRCTGFDKTRWINCVAMATNASGSFRPDVGFNYFIGCEAAFCNGDGFNGHFSAWSGYANLPDNRTHYPTTVLEQCWAHDNYDDGESSHENHNVVMLRCLLEHNGDSGCRPSNDATYYAADCTFRYNGWEVGVGDSRGEGFAVVNPPISTHRIACSAVLYNCVSYGNNIGYGAITSPLNRIEFINCVSRDNTTAEYFVASGAKMRLRNCRGTNADPAKIKKIVLGEIEVLNDELVV